MSKSEIYEEAKKLMIAAFDNLEQSTASLSGLANLNVNIAKSIIVSAYKGSSAPLSSLANISKVAEDTLSAKPWDSSAIKSIRSSIDACDLGVSTNVVGDIIMIKFPPITVEYKRNLVKTVKSNAENAKISMRNTRRIINEKIKKLESEPGFSKDKISSMAKDIQKLTDDYILKVDNFFNSKSKSILS